MNFNWLMTGTFLINVVLISLFVLLIRSLLERRAFDPNRKTIETSRK